MKNKRILITGAAGSIGSALAQRIAKLKPKLLVVLDSNESGLFNLAQDIPAEVKTVIASIRDEDRLEEIFAQYKPDMVFHTAAYKHVPLMESNPREALKTNVGGLLNVVLCALEHKVKKFVFISTDKAVQPSSVMGMTKKYGERICKIANGKTKFISVRFGNVMASNGSLIPILQKQIAENKPLTVTSSKMKRYMMGIYEAVDLILKAAQVGKGGETYVLDMGDPVKIVDFVKLMLKISGKDLPIKLTGVRPGEKLFERLHDRKSEKLVQTKYKNILQII